jgi:hypothetical protein
LSGVSGVAAATLAIHPKVSTDTPEPNADLVMRRPEGLWEELVQRSRVAKKAVSIETQRRAGDTRARS